VIVYAVVDDALSPDFPLGDAVEPFVRREDAERFIEEVRGDEPEMAAKLRNRGAGARGRAPGARRVRSEAASCRGGQAAAPTEAWVTGLGRPSRPPSRRHVREQCSV